MHKTLGNLCLWASFVVFMGLAGAAFAKPDQAAMDLSTRLTALQRALAADPWAPVDLPEIAAAEPAQTQPVLQPIGLAPVTAQAAPAMFQMLDLRLPLAMITQSHGAGDNDTVLAAQGPNGPQALVLRRGHARLADLQREALSAGAARLDDKGAVVLTRPLVVWDEAHLTLSPGDALRLDRAAGAFVLILGEMDATQATIAGTTVENPHAPRFRPFVVAGSGGLMTITGSTVSGLGFGHTEKFAGLSVVRNGLMMGRGQVALKGNLFRDVASVWIDTAQDAQITGNRFQAAPKVPLVVTNAGRPAIRDNLFFDNGDFNAIQVLRGSYAADVSGNVVLGGKRAGIVVKFDSHRTRITRNIVWKRDGTGIIFAKSNCGLLQNNWVMQNRQKGIEVRTSRGTELRDNRVALNRNTGLWVSAQAEDTATLLQGNVFSQNRAGLTTATAAHLVMAGNDFSGQVPRFLSGDVATQNAVFARGMAGTDALVLTASGVATDTLPPTGCVEGRAR